MAVSLSAKTLYFAPHDNWKQANARFAVYAFNNTENAWASMDTVPGEAGLYQATVDDKYSTVIFCRMNPAAAENNWNDDVRWNQTGNLALEEGKDLYTLTGGEWNNVTGAWSKHGSSEDPVTPPTPAAKDSIYFVNVAGWAQPTVHLWGGTAAGTTWPGVAMAKLADKINNYDVYKYVADEGAYANCIFSNNGKNQTADLAWTSGKYFYNDAWYALDSIPAPVPVAKFWVAGGEDIVGAGHGTWSKESALVSYKDTLTLNLAAGAHELKLITENDEWWGYEHLTDTAAGVYTNGYTNVCFKLAEAGAVNVIYKAGEVFKVEGNFYVAPVEEQAKFYVLGDSTLVVNAGLTADKAWTPDAIKSMSDTLVLNLGVGDYTMRISLYGGWDNNKGYESLTDTAAGLREYVDEYQNHNIIFTLAEAGAVTIIYNENEFKLIGNFYVAPAPDPTAAVIGDMTEWQQAIPFVLSQDKKSASFSDTIPAGSYEVKMIINGEWRSNGGTISREHPTAIVTGNVEANMMFVADTKGLYTFTWTFANDSFSAVYPEYVEPVAPDTAWYLVGDMTDWEAGKISFAEGAIVANLTDEGRTYGFKVLKVVGDDMFWYGNAGTMTRENHENWVFETTIDANGMLIADVAGEYTFAMALNEVGNPVVTVTYPEAPQPVLETGFYLVGYQLNSWTPAAEYHLVGNPNNTDEFMINITLTEGDSLKVVNVLNDNITAWYPGDGAANYVVDANHAGETTVYFRPDYQGGESWYAGCIFVVPTGTVDVQNVNADAKAVKVLRNSEVIIIRGEHTYTVMGQLIK